MKNFVINLLRDNLPEAYYYHNYKHTLYVIDRALEIGSSEGCSAEELELIHTSALWHDTGYIRTYKNHEEESCLLAREYLPGFGYSPEYVEKVCSMIMATRIPQLPKNKLEEILADADLEYLGSDSFVSKADGLFREMQSVNPQLTLDKWNEMQISFLKNHHYFTNFCKQHKESIKQQHLQQLLLVTGKS
jgi:predicted metal-dependent HD superfamily phosphohydrolase